MNHKSFHMTMATAAAAVAFLALSGSSSAAEPHDASPDPQQFARGAKAWAENCNRCHNLRDSKEMDDYEWYVSVTHMRVLAGLPGDMARDIRAFLMSSN